MGTGLVWYASYGSNLKRERFLAYIKGGAPPGQSFEHRGARDRTPPRDDRRIDIPHQLFFARDSSGWGPGGVAFVEPVRRPDAHTIGRAYLVTVEQFEDVLSQENRWSEPRPFPLEEALAVGWVDLGEGWYDRSVSLGVLDGAPVLTFTESGRDGDQALRPPAASYIATISQGLTELGLSADEIVRYLRDKPGIDGRMSDGELAAAVLPASA